MNRRQLVSALCCGTWLASPTPTLAQLPIEAFETPTHATFSDFAGLGFSPNPATGQIDSNAWRVIGLSDGDGTFAGFHESGDFARGISMGGRSTGGVYALTLPDLQPALAVQATSADFTPGAIILRVSNRSEQTIHSLQVESTLWILNDQDRATQVTLSHSSDDETYLATGAVLTTTTQRDDEPAWERVSLMTEITGLLFEPDQTYFIAWQAQDGEGSGGRDEIALDRVTLTAHGDDNVVAPCSSPERPPSLCTILVPGETGGCVAVNVPFGVRCSPEGNLCDGAGTCVQASVLPAPGPADAGGPAPATNVGSDCSSASPPPSSSFALLVFVFAWLRNRRPRTRSANP